VAHERFGVGGAVGGDEGCDAGSGTPASIVSSCVWEVHLVGGDIQDGDIVTTVVQDDGVTGQSGGNESLERDGAEKGTGVHFCFKRVWRMCKIAMNGRLTSSQKEWGILRKEKWTEDAEASKAA
jgi:hypothetical protein